MKNNLYELIKEFVYKIDEYFQCYSHSVGFSLSFFKLSFGKMEVIIEADTIEFDEEIVSFVKDNNCIGMETLTIPTDSIIKIDSEYGNIWTQYGNIEYLGDVF